MSQIIEAVYEVKGSLPQGYGYRLYSALCGAIPQLHDKETRWQVLPLYGDWIAGTLYTNSHTKLVIRAPALDESLLRKLCLKKFDIGGHKLLIGIGSGEDIKPGKNLSVRNLILSTSFHNAGRVDEATVEGFLKNYLEKMESSASYHICFGGLVDVKGYKQISFRIVLQGVEPDKSLLMQSRGIGRYKKMGCGSFIRLRDDYVNPRTRQNSH